MNMDSRRTVPNYSRIDLIIGIGRRGFQFSCRAFSPSASTASLAASAADGPPQPPPMGPPPPPPRGLALPPIDVFASFL